MTAKDSGPNEPVTRKRKDIFRELELILEAKKNINGIITTMYAVFFSLEGFLLYGFFVLGAVPARVSISLFGIAALIGLAFVTVRTQGTNDRCDRRASELEKLLGVQIILNYYNSHESRSPSFIYRARMHDTLFWVDLVLVAFWIVLAALAMMGRV